MFRVCAWCNRLLGFGLPLSDPGITHGVCGECADRLLREARGTRGQSIIIVRRSRRYLRDRLEAAVIGFPDVIVRMDQRAAQRRQGARHGGPNRRRLERRQALFPSQLAAWQTLGVFIVHLPA